MNENNLDLWIEHKLNVLMIGHAGVGKTQRVLEAFERNKLKYRYFSCSTIDPWVDFVGIPFQNKDERGAFLDLARPKEFRDDEIEIIFADEFNRAAKKTTNALMELIQFKSINGRKFNNLRAVWAAVNPDDEGYNVERLDAAQLDRFQIQVTIPYKADTRYFAKLYGEQGRNAVAWWDALTKEAQKQISPRRLEYALKVYNIKGDVKYVLPESANISSFTQSLGCNQADVLDKFRKANNIDGARAYLAIENNYNAAKPAILNKARIGFFLPLLDKEKISQLVATNSVARRAWRKFDHPVYVEMAQEILTAKTDKVLCKQILPAYIRAMPPTNELSVFAKDITLINSHVVSDLTFSITQFVAFHKYIQRFCLVNTVPALYAKTILATYNQMLKRQNHLTIQNFLNIDQVISKLKNECGLTLTQFEATFPRIRDFVHAGYIKLT